MNYLDELTNAINEDNLTTERLSILKNLIKSKFPESLKKQQKIYESICQKIIESIKSNDIDLAISLLKLIYISENYSLGHTCIKSSGIFRSSKYEYEYKHLENIINIIKEFLASINLNNFSTYFNSVLNILQISYDIKIEYDKIASILQDNSILRLLLTNSDHNFLSKNENPEFYIFSNSIQESIIKELFFSPEETSSSVSRVLKIYINSRPKNLVPEANFNTLVDSKKNIAQILKSAFILNKYEDIEIDVTIFEYNSLFENNKLTIKGEELEKQKRVGYFLSDQNRKKLTINFLEDKNNNKIHEFDKLKQLIIELDAEGKIKPYSLLKNPDRFALNPQVNLLKTAGFNSEKLFKEDVIRLIYISHDNYLHDDNFHLEEPIPEIKIHGNFSVLNYLNLERIFKLTNYSLIAAYTNNHDKIHNIDEFLSNSILQIFQKDQLINLIKNIISLDNNTDVDSFLEPIILNITEDSDHVDLQYTPILKINENEYLTLTATSFTSDLIRRICIKNKLSFSIDKSKKPVFDHMVADLEQNFKNRDFLVKTDFKFSKFELDFIAFKDNELFIFECKNPYHPVSNHELRNTYDHIEHAFFQLERAKLELEENNKLPQLFEQLGWSDHYNDNISVHYGVCNANRMFVGYSNNGIYIHHAHQLRNLLQTGKVQNFDITESLWESDDFNTNDLVQYVNGKISNKTYTELTEKYHFNFRTTNFNICIESYLSGMEHIRKKSQIENNISVQLEDYL